MSERAPTGGSLVGKVIWYPVSPTEVGDESAASRDAPGVKLLILNAQGIEVNSVVTDEKGRYRITLPQGIYRIEMALHPGDGFTKDLPKSVTITEGEESRLDIRLDTGIR